MPSGQVPATASYDWVAIAAAGRGVAGPGRARGRPHGHPAWMSNYLPRKNWRAESVGRCGAWRGGQVPPPTSQLVTPVDPSEDLPARRGCRTYPAAAPWPCWRPRVRIACCRHGNAYGRWSKSGGKSSQAHDTGFDLRQHSTVVSFDAAPPVCRLRIAVSERIPVLLSGTSSGRASGRLVTRCEGEACI
jgi:hypothetical protein